MQSSTIVFTPQEALQVRNCSAAVLNSPLLSAQREDYTPLGSPYAKGKGEMHWSMCERQSCFRIGIIDNYPEVEDVEYFNFSLLLENDVVRNAEIVDPQGAVFILPRRM